MYSCLGLSTFSQSSVSVAEFYDVLIHPTIEIDVNFGWQKKTSKVMNAGVYDIIENLVT